MAEVIKSSTLPANEVQLIKLTDFREEAQELLIKAQQEAAAIKEKAYQEAEEIREAAYLEGMARAEAENESRVQAEVAQQNQHFTLNLKNIRQQLDQAEELWRAGSENRFLQLILEAATLLTRKEMGSDRSISQQWLQEALDLARGSTRFEVHVPPAELRHYEFMQKALLNNDEMESIQFLADDQISPGGCKLCLANGEIDQQLEAQVARLWEELFGRPLECKNRFSKIIRNQEAV
ncbi:Hypothetical protein PBC10988_30100 [Planctomycetales bacterium 10988]|nr:Hypothetical protein PBC10988_30100 [Planctomycetales bacterium 10988]